MALSPFNWDKSTTGATTKGGLNSGPFGNKWMATGNQSTLLAKSMFGKYTTGTTSSRFGTELMARPMPKGIPNIQSPQIRQLLTSLVGERGWAPESTPASVALWNNKGSEPLHPLYSISEPFLENTGALSGYRSVGGWLMNPEQFEQFKAGGLGAIKSSIYPSISGTLPPPIEYNDLTKRFSQEWAKGRRYPAWYYDSSKRSRGVGTTTNANKKGSVWDWLYNYALENKMYDVTPD